MRNRKYVLPLATLITLALILLLPGSGCKKETTCNGVPNVSVYFTVTLNTGYPQLNPVNGSEEFSGGYANNGVLVYHFQQNTFLAYDCTCPYDGQSNGKAIVAVQTNGLYAVCPICGSSFLLSNGSPNKGPSACPLKAYTANYDQTSSTITVQN